MRYLLSVMIGACVFSDPRAADAPLGLGTENEQVNYSVGYQIGGDFRRQGVEVDAEAVARGIADALSDSEALMTEDERAAASTELRRRIAAVQSAEARKRSQEERAAELTFLGENAKRQGVVTLPSGLQYEILRQGSGRSPGPEDRVRVAYRSRLVNGTEFDNSEHEDAPKAFALDEVIPGWQEALQLMKEGAEWRLFVPPDLGFHRRSPLRDRVLLFDVELIAVEATQSADANRGVTGDGSKQDNP